MKVLFLDIDEVAAHTRDVSCELAAKKYMLSKNTKKILTVCNYREDFLKD